MKIFMDNRFATVISGKYLSSLINNIHRFQANITEAKTAFFQGVLASMEKASISTIAYTGFMDNKLKENTSSPLKPKY